MVKLRKIALASLAFVLAVGQGRGAADDWDDSFVVDTVEVDSIEIDTVAWAADLVLPAMFTALPDSLLPTLSLNNRLDMLDFMQAGMKAEVTNLLGGTSEMTALADDSLSLRVSDALTANMMLLHPAADTLRWIVCLAQTFGTDSLALSTDIRFYDNQWQRLEVRPVFSDADERRINNMNLQTILKWDENILKKD